MYGWNRTPSGNYCHHHHTDLLITKLWRKYPSNSDKWELRKSNGYKYELVSTFPTLRLATQFVEAINYPLPKKSGN